jgi:endonuclease/exonuclease/phosphatase family metal-dependent hydrolase
VANPQHRIDGVFSRAAEVTSYRVVDTPDARAASDHFPVVVELTLPG